MAVSKYVGPLETAALLAAGCSILGESRPQQLWDKAALPALDTAQWHLVGHLQRNKIHRTLPLVDLIHSVDSRRLLLAIDREAAKLDRKMSVLLEVNCSGEAEKQGLTPDGAEQLLAELSDLTHVKITGLMTMAARDGGEAIAAKNFALLRNLRDRLQQQCPAEIKLAELSMGMTGDFEVAIAEGATLVRIGRLLWEGVGQA